MPKNTNNVLVQVMKEAMLVGWPVADVARAAGVCYATARGVKLGLVHKGIQVGLEMQRAFDEAERVAREALERMNEVHERHERGEATWAEVEKAQAAFWACTAREALKEKAWKKLEQFGRPDRLEKGKR